MKNINTIYFAAFADRRDSPRRKPSSFFFGCLMSSRGKKLRSKQKNASCKNKEAVLHKATKGTNLPGGQGITKKKTFVFLRVLRGLVGKEKQRIKSVSYERTKCTNLPGGQVGLLCGRDADKAPIHNIYYRVGTKMSASVSSQYASG